MKFLAILCALLSGCASLPTGQRFAEGTYQALHVVDTLQTLDIKNHPCQVYDGVQKCHWESNPLLGKYPSDARIATYMVAEALAHAWVTQALVDSDAPQWVQWTWQIASIGFAADRVAENARLGMAVKLQWGATPRNRIGFGHTECGAFAGCP